MFTYILAYSKYHFNLVKLRVLNDKTKLLKFPCLYSDTMAINMGNLTILFYRLNLTS